MVTESLRQLTAWQNDSNVAVIVIKGAGKKSFCSGGDVKTVVQEALAGREQYAIDFFTNEYKLDHAIHESKKPITVLAHGYVMGGGIGLLAGANCRVLTETSVVAMPEITIGLFPDVGGSYFLNDAPGKLGLFLALTGARLNARDAIFAKLADVFIPDGELENFCRTLERTTWTSPSNDTACDKNRRTLRTLAQDFAKPFEGLLPPSRLETVENEINECLRGSDLADQFRKLAELKSHPDPFLAKAAQTFSKGSPTSAFVMAEQIRRGQTLSLGACLRMELDLAIQFCRRHDFKEGVRALLIDKDQSPRWKPNRIDEVTEAAVLSHFASPWQGTSHPLENL